MAKDTDRNPDGTFKRKDDAGGEDVPAATEREMESMTVHGGEDAQDQFIESLDRPGLGEGEAGSKIEELMKAAEESPEEVPDDVDPEALEAARRALDEEGSIDAAKDAIEEGLKQSEAEEAQEQAEGPEPVPFENLASDLGFDDINEAAEAVTVTAKVDGETVEMPLSEAVDGYQRQSTFTKRTQELAEKRREVEQKGAEYAQALEMIGVTLGDQLTPQQQQALVNRYNEVVQQVTDATTPDPESIQEEQQALRETFDWEGDSEWQEARQGIREYAHDLGFTDQDLASVTDHRLLAIVEKARRYDEISGSTESQLEAGKQERRSPTLKPGVDRQTAESVERTRRRRREEGRRGHSKPALKMSGSDTVEDAADRIAGILADEGS